MAGQSPSPHFELSPEQAGEVHRLLAQRTRDVRLRGELREIYRKQSWHRRSNQVRSWMYWVAALNVMMMFYYRLLIPQHLWLGVMVSGLIISPTCLLVAYIWRKPRSALVEGLSTSLSGAFCVSAVAVLGSIAGGYDQERFVTGSMFIVVTSVILFSVDFLWTIALAAASMAIFTITHIFNPLMPWTIVVTISTFYSAGMAALVVSRHTMNIVANRAFLLSLRDRINVKALAQANAQLQVLATTDPLTGIANRRVATEHIAKLCEQVGRGHPPVMIMVDIDHFKRINDTCGHAQGDIALKQVAETIRASIRPSVDMVARYGGEEFIVVLDDAPRSFAFDLAECIRHKIEAIGIDNPGSPHNGILTVSIGLAIAYDGEPAEKVVQRADLALYEAKASGRNRVAISAGSKDDHPIVFPMPAFHDTVFQRQSDAVFG